MNDNVNKKKQKLKMEMFNKYFKSMQKEIKIVLKKTSHPSFEAVTYKDITNFSLDMNLNIELFNKKDPLLLKKVQILDLFFSTKPTLSSANVEVVWKYLELMFSIVEGQKKEVAVVKQPFDISKLLPAMTNLMTDPNSGLSDLITTISEKLSTTLEGKEIDQETLMKDLLSGSTSSSGINFADIISQTTEVLKEKIEKGEVNIDKIKEITRLE